jgi:hypothetical protein
LIVGIGLAVMAVMLGKTVEKTYFLQEGNYIYAISIDVNDDPDNDYLFCIYRDGENIQSKEGAYERDGNAITFYTDDGNVSTLSGVIDDGAKKKKEHKMTLNGTILETEFHDKTLLKFQSLMDAFKAFGMSAPQKSDD